MVACLLLSYLLIREMLIFADGRSPIITELMAAILGSIITVAAMASMIKMQATQDKEKEYAAKIFDYKVTIYDKLITAIFKSDDDNILDKEEIGAIENHVGIACMVANEKLVSQFAQFVIQLKGYGVMYFRSMSPMQVEHFGKFVAAELSLKPKRSQLSYSKHELGPLVAGHEGKYFLSLDELLQGMRNDLAVVEGDISQEVEHFVRMPYDSFSMIRDPNVVD